jgi:hypothetical protein
MLITIGVALWAGAMGIFWILTVDDPDELITRGEEKLLVLFFFLGVVLPAILRPKFTDLMLQEFWQLDLALQVVVSLLIFIGGIAVVIFGRWLIREMNVPNQR